MTTCELIEDVARLEALGDGWDQLAVDAGEPFRSPHWMLPWWEHASPAGARLRVVAVTDGDALVGLAPLYSDPRRSSVSRYRFLSAPAALRTGPLVRPGHEAEVMHEVCRILGPVDPPADLITLDGVSTRDGWPQQMRSAWPGGRPPRVLHDISRPAPWLDLSQGTYETWLASKSKNFREQMRRRRRKLEKMGATFRLTKNESEVEADLDSFIRLHHSRWKERGGSGVLTNAVERMLPTVAGRLLAGGRFRLWTLEVDGRAISSHLFIAAGGDVSYWLGGFDEEWSAQQPSLQVLIVAIEDAWARGDRRVDLGGGGQSYKYRLADLVETLEWSYFVPAGPKYARSRAELLPTLTKRAVLARIPKESKDRVKRALGRATSGAAL